MNKSESIGALAAALSKAQGQFRPAIKDSENPHFRSKYADLAAVWDAVRGPLTENGLAVVQTCDIPEGSNGVVIGSTLLHSSGEWVGGRVYMPCPKFDPQGVGSAMTYGRRYAFCALLGIVADEDDDANAVMPPKHQKPPAGANKPPAAAAAPDMTEKHKEYIDRIKAALKAIYGDNKETALARVEKETAFTGKDGKAVPGMRDFTKLSEISAKILAHTLEKESQREGDAQRLSVTSRFLGLVDSVG